MSLPTNNEYSKYFHKANIIRPRTHKKDAIQQNINIYSSKCYTKLITINTDFVPNKVQYIVVTLKNKNIKKFKNWEKLHNTDL